MPSTDDTSKFKWTFAHCIEMKGVQILDFKIWVSVERDTYIEFLVQGLKIDTDVFHDINI